MTSWLEICPAAAGWDRGKGQKDIYKYFTAPEMQKQGQKYSESPPGFDGGLVRMSKDSFFSSFELYAHASEPGMEFIFYGASKPMHST